MTKQRNRKYAVYYNRDWFKALCIERYGGAAYAERHRLQESIYQNVQDFLSGKGELNIMLCESFIGPDGKMHKVIEFKIIEGRHSGKPLKRLNNKRKNQNKRK